MSQYAAGDDLPCADAALLVPLKKSPEYRALRSRVANPRAADSWQEDGLHFFVFELLAVETGAAPGADAPVAVFAMHPEEPGPVSAVVVTPSASGEEAEIVDLLRPDSAYSAPVTSNDHQARNGDSAAADLSNGEMSAGPEEPLGTGIETGANQNSEGDGDAQPGLRLPARLKESPEYLGWDVRNLEPVDSWQEDELKFVVFQLHTAGAPEASMAAPRVLFTLRAEDDRLVSAAVMSPPSGDKSVVDVGRRDGVDYAHHERQVAELPAHH